MCEDLLNAIKRNQKIDRKDAYSLLNAQVKEYSERVAHNSQILFLKAVEKGVYPHCGDLNSKNTRHVFEAVKYFDVGYAAEDGETIYSGRAIPIQHVKVGAEIILSDVKTLEEFKALSGQEKIIRKMARDAANYHHERWDGQGYPEGFKMEEIPVIARICSICFAFETLTSNAGKQVAISKEEAAQQIKGESGKAFDPVLVDVFADTVSEMSIKGDCLISYEKRRADEKNQSRANKKKTSTYFDYKKTKDKLRAVEMWYQPIVDTQTNKIKYYESLMRMNDRYYGVVNPALFIPVAEKTGQICELTEIALEQILETIILSDEKKLSFDRIALNISAKHLTRKTFFSKTEKMIKHSGVSPDRLIFEITESVMATADENLLSTIAALQNIGIKIAIDDFGTEYSSLYRLNKIDVDILKIDKSFIDTMTESAKTRGVIKGIIDMAQNLDIEVVSEGVETQNQREILESLGCYVMQGYLYSKPKTLSQIIG